MFAHQLHRFGNVAEVGGTIGAQVSNVFGGADRPFDFWTVATWAAAGVEVKGQPHDFERKKQIGEDDGRIDVENLSSFDGDLGRYFGLLADLDQRILLADGAVLGHVASGLAHEPDGSPFRGLSLGSANKKRAWGRHEPSNLTSLQRLWPHRALTASSAGLRL